jgi:hypothetical protein
VTEAAGKAGVSPGKVRRWLQDDSKFIAARNAALAERDDRPRAELAALGPKAVGVLKDALDGYGESVAGRAAVEVVKLLKINEPPPVRASDPAKAESEVLRRRWDAMTADLGIPSWVHDNGQEGDE